MAIAAVGVASYSVINACGLALGGFAGNALVAAISTVVVAILGQCYGSCGVAMGLVFSSSVILTVLHSNIFLTTLASKVGAVFFLYQIAYLSGLHAGRNRLIGSSNKIPLMVTAATVVAGIAIAYFFGPLWGLTVGIATCFELGYMRKPLGSTIVHSLCPAQYASTVGLTASLPTLFYQGIRVPYYYLRTVCQGALIKKDTYMKEDATFSNQKELAFLQCRFSYLKSREELQESSLETRIYLKAIIPLVGLSWVLLTEPRAKENLVINSLLSSGQSRPAIRVEGEAAKEIANEMKLLKYHIYKLTKKLERRDEILNPINSALTKERCVKDHYKHEQNSDMPSALANIMTDYVFALEEGASEKEKFSKEAFRKAGLRGEVLQDLVVADRFREEMGRKIMERPELGPIMAEIHKQRVDQALAPFTFG